MTVRRRISGPTRSAAASSLGRGSRHVLAPGARRVQWAGAGAHRGRLTRRSPRP